MAEFLVKKKLFGKIAEIFLLDIDKTMGEMIAESAYQEALRLHKIFNFYDKTSELSLLNQKRNLSKASPELLEVLNKAIKFSKLTDGEYDVSLGKLFLARKKGEKESKLDCSYRDIIIDQNSNSILLTHPDVLIDLGSIAKGYIADKMVDCLKKEGALSGYIDARGDICVFGKYTQKIGLQHPREKDKMIDYLNLSDCAIATSGDYNQYVESHENSHILNAKQLVSVTVIAPTLMDADIFASALFVSNKDLGEKLLKQNKFIKALTIDKKLQITYYNRFENFLAR